MTSPRLCALGALVAAVLATGSTVPTSLTDPGHIGPGTEAIGELTRTEVAGTSALTADGEVVGLLPPLTGGPAVVQATTFAGRTLIAPVDSAGVPETPTELGADPVAPLSHTRDGATSLHDPEHASADTEPTPDYCRDPANGRPTQPAPGKVPVSISTIDRHGRPAGGSFTMMDYHCEPYEANGYITFGVTPGDQRTFYLPPGTYSLMGQVTTLDASGTLPDQVTFGGDPQFEVVAGEPLQLTVDARDGEPLQLDTPEPSEPSLIVLGWTRGIEGNPPLLESTVIYPQSTSITGVSVIPSDPVTDGVFEFFPWIRATDPWVSGRILGQGGRIDLDLTLVNPLDATGFTHSPRPTMLRADVGEVRSGEAVLLTEGPDLAAQVAHAESAGAVAVLVRPAGEGLTHPSVPASVPLLAVSAGEGEQILDRLARGRGGTPLWLTVDPYADYAYDLIDSLPAVDPDPYPELTQDDLTTVEQTFHTDGAGILTLETRAPSADPCTCLLTPVFDMVEPGSTRVDHVIDNGSRWQQTVMNDSRLQARTSPGAYDGTMSGNNRWFGGSVGSGLKVGFEVTHAQAPATMADGQLRLRLGATDGAGHDLAGGFTRSGSISRDGEVVADAFTGSATLDAPTQPAAWQVDLTTTHPRSVWQYSTTVHSVWEFTAGAADDETPRGLPMLDAITCFPVEADSQRTPRGTLTVEPWRADNAMVSTSVTVELSHDGGATWSVQHGRMVDGVWTSRPTSGTGPVDMRLTLTDDTGSTLTRTIEAAWTD